MNCPVIKRACGTTVSRPVLFDVLSRDWKLRRFELARNAAEHGVLSPTVCLSNHNEAGDINLEVTVSGLARFVVQSDMKGRRKERSEVGSRVGKGKSADASG